MAGPVIVRSLSAANPSDPPGSPRRVGRIGHLDDVALAVARICTVVFTAASSAVVARSLGPQGYGVFAAGAAVATLMVVGKAFGADALYLRGDIDEATFSRRALVSAGINIALVVLAGMTWPGLTWSGRGCEIFMGTAWAVAFARLPWQVVPARNLQFALRARRELLLSAVSLGGVMVLAGLFRRPVLASAGLLGGTLLVVAWSLRSLTLASPSDARRTQAGSVRRGLSFTAIEGLFLAYFTVDGAMIAAMRPPVDAGVYRVAYAFVFAAAVVPVALNGDVLRVRLWQLDGAERAHALRRATILTAVAATVVTLAFELLGGIGERMFFGAAFAAAVPVIRLLGIAMPFHYANSVLSNVLVGAGRVTTVIRVQSTMLAVNVIGNLWLIPTHGPRGAAIATALTEAAGLLVFLVARTRGALPSRS